MGPSFVPSILRPDFTWPRPAAPLRVSQTTPPVPPVPSRPIRRAWGFAHRSLYYVSKWYCSLLNIYCDPQILQLPFGLVMEWTDRTSLEEAISMQMVAAAGIPVPKLLSCGEHPKDPYNRKYSILMTRLRGVTLENLDDELRVDVEEPWLEELKTCMDGWRAWEFG